MCPRRWTTAQLEGATQAADVRMHVALGRVRVARATRNDGSFDVVT